MNIFRLNRIDRTHDHLRSLPKKITQKSLQILILYYTLKAWPQKIASKHPSTSIKLPWFHWFPWFPLVPQHLSATSRRNVSRLAISEGEDWKRPPFEGIGALSAGASSRLLQEPWGILRSWGRWGSMGIEWDLVGGLEHLDYFAINIGKNHPNWLSYFSEGFKPPTRDSWDFGHWF